MLEADVLECSALLTAKLFHEAGATFSTDCIANLHFFSDYYESSFLTPQTG